MTYVVIGKKPVYISWKLYGQLKAEFFGKDNIPLTLYRGTKEAEDFSKAQYTILEKKYKDNPNTFINNYMTFDLVGDDAINNVWDILYDYCHYKGYACLTDIRKFGTHLKDDYSGDSYFFPMGKIFAVDHFVNPYRWWWRFTAKMKGRTVRLIISVDDITRIVGSLDDFLIYTNNFIVRCSKEFEIVPIDYYQ